MQYNRSLDYLALAMNELRKGKPVLAARLLQTASVQPDAEKALAIIEASNGQAFKPLQAKLKASKTAVKRLKADAEEYEDEEVDDEVEADVDQDPLDEVEDDADEGDEVDDEVEASKVMANTLRRMVRRG